MDQARTVRAVFERIEWPLLVAIVGKGDVQGSGIDCPGTCSGIYGDGTEIVLRATPAPDWRFVGWEGDCTPEGNTCLARMDQARSVRARFATGQAVPDPKLRIRIDIPRKEVFRGNYFKAQVVLRNINRFTAIDAQPCLLLPGGVRVIRGGVVGDGRICWFRKDLQAGDGRRFDLLLRARALGRKKFVAVGRASNAPKVRDRDQIRVIRRQLPHPPTG